MPAQKTGLEGKKRGEKAEKCPFGPLFSSHFGKKKA
jgi:hypothetical protein